MVLSRRSFLQFSVAAGFGAGLSPQFLFADNIADKRYYISGAQSGKQNFACRIALENYEADAVPIDFKAHAFLQNPEYATRFWAIDKWGTGTCEVDFKEKKILGRLPCDDAAPFFGHAAISPDKKVIYCTRYHYDKAVGYLTGYNTSTYKQVSHFKVTRGAPHDCQFLNDGTMLVCNNGNAVKRLYPAPGVGKQLEKTALVHVNVNTRTIINKIVIDDMLQIAGHFAVLKDGTLIALTKSIDSKKDSHGLVYKGHLSKKNFEPLDIPADVQAKLRGEILSIALDKKEEVAVITNPTGNTVMAINPKTGSFMGSITNSARSVGFEPENDSFIAAGNFLFPINGKLETGTQRPVHITSGGIEGIVELNSSHSILV